MKKYVWLLALILLLTLPMVAACSGKQEPVPSPVQAPAPAPVLAPQPTPVGEITVIPHPLDGRTDCLLCHRNGIGDAKAVPADHTSRTNDQCTACHKPAG